MPCGSDTAGDAGEMAGDILGGVRISAGAFVLFAGAGEAFSFFSGVRSGDVSADDRWRSAHIQMYTPCHTKKNKK